MRTLGVGILFALSIATAKANAVTALVKVEGGTFKLFATSLKKTGDRKVKLTSVKTFDLDQTLVSNADFLRFVRNRPEWRKSQVKSLFADQSYLKLWPSDLRVPKIDLQKPVVFVSWFAASAFCESLSKQLPSTEQWEYALADNGKDQAQLQAKILAWYSKPNTSKLPSVTSAEKNGLSIIGLGTVVWEWTSDFNSFMLASDSRDSGTGDSNLFCGAGSQMGDASDYAAFMRYSFRASLKANYTTANLGFRCAKGD